MAHLILPQRWQRKPSGLIEIDWRNELTRGLAHCYVGGEAYHVNRVGNSASGTQYQRMKLVASAAGIGSGGTGNAGLTAVGGPNALPVSIGVVAGARANGNGPLLGVSTAGNAASGMAAVGTNYAGAAWPEYRIDVDAGVMLRDTSAASSLVNSDRAYVCRSRSSTDHALIVGTRITTDTSARTVVDGDGLVGVGLLLAHNYSSFYLNTLAWMHLGCMWYRSLDNAEAFAFNAAPWQIFRPRRRVLYFAAPAGGWQPQVFNGASWVPAVAASRYDGSAWQVITTPPAVL